MTAPPDSTGRLHGRSPRTRPTSSPPRRRTWPLDPVLTTVVSSVTHRALEEVERGAPAPGAPALVGRRPGRRRRGRGRRDADGAVRAVPALRAADAGRGGAGARPGAARPRRGGRRRERRAARRPGGRRRDRPAGGGAASVHEHTRLFELGDLVEPAAGAGPAAAGGRADAALALRWFRGLRGRRRRAGRPRGRGRRGATSSEDEMRERIAAGRIWLWEDETGEPVHLTGFNPPSFGVARVGPVYTPKAHRGRGLRQRGRRRGLAPAARGRGAGLPLHRPGEPDLEQDLPGASGSGPSSDMANLVVTRSPDQAGAPADPALDSGGDD